MLFQNVHTGTIKVKMQLHTTVPTRVHICSQASLVYHQGQTCTCYNRNQDGNEAKKCLKKQQPQQKSKHPKRTEGPWTSSSSTMETAPLPPPSDAPSSSQNLLPKK